MNLTSLFDDGERKWVFLGRDLEKGSTLIDTNEYLILNKDKGMLLDPGGIEIFPSVVSYITKEIEVENIESLFASHQDPDIISSLSLWLSLNTDLKVYGSWIWSGFLPHFGGGRAIVPIPDEGMQIPLNGSNDLIAIPAHYCHSSGNFSLYDPRAKILFSGDIGAALLPDNYDSIFVKDFEDLIQYIEGFHRRWMPSNKAKNRWIERVRTLDIKMMCPQHGAIYKGDDINKFLDWFEKLQVGSAN